MLLSAEEKTMVNGLMTVVRGYAEAALFISSKDRKAALDGAANMLVAATFDYVWNWQDGQKPVAPKGGVAPTRRRRKKKPGL